MNKFAKRVAAAALTGALALGGLVAAQPAKAAVIPGTFTITPTTGSATLNPMLLSAETSVACPVGSTGNGTYAFQNGVNKGTLALIRDASVTLYGNNGLTSPYKMDLLGGPNPYMSSRALSSRSVVAGDWEIRFYCFVDATLPDLATDAYIPLAMTLDAAGTWAVKGTTVPSLPTATSLTALPNQTSKTVSLTATVKTPDSNGSVATAATGSIQFTQNGANIGLPVAVANGVATYTTPALVDGGYSFTSVFTPTGTVYSGSTSGTASAEIGVVIPPPSGQTDTAVIDVTLPGNTGSVSFAGLRDAISLGTATLTGGFFTASGSLSGPSNASPIVITDTRQEGSTRWSLTGTVSDFVSGGKILEGKYLGWTPTLVAPGPNAGTAGPAIAPAPTTVAGLKAPASVLSTGLVVRGVQTTTVDAALNLIAPSTTPGGLYTSTLTLTLVS